MADVLQMKPEEPAAEPPIHDYPEEHNYSSWGFGASIAAHLTVILIVLIIAYLNHIKNPRDLFASTMAMPPPPTEVEVVLEEDLTPPPPTDHPLFIKQILQLPKPIIPPKPKPKPVPKPPHPMVQHVTVSHTESKAESQLVVGSGNFPKPDYPFTARQHGIHGTVVMHIVFDGSGGVASADVVSSSGSSILDSSAKSTVLDSWRDATFAGKTETVPIVFDLNHP